MPVLAPNPNSIKAGDTEPLIATLVDAKGPIDLTGCSVRMRMKSRVAGRGHAPISGLCAILQHVDLTTGRVRQKGQVSYTWGTGQTDIPGSYDVEFVLTGVDSKIRTFPNDRAVTLTIVPDAA